MRRYLKLYVIFIKQHFKMLMEYRFDFLTGALSFLISQTVGVIFLALIFNGIPALAGYSFEQVLFFYGFAQLPKGLDHLVADNFWELAYFRISKGEFDRYLIRPINPLAHAIMEKFQIDAFGEILVGVAIMAYSIVKMGLTITVLDVILFIVVIPFCALIFTNMKIITCAVALKTKRSGALMQIFYQMNEFSKYPIDIYNIVIKTFITFIVPFALSAYFPASYFLEHKNPLFNLGGVVVISVAFFALAYFIWNKCISLYESAGS